MSNYPADLIQAVASAIGTTFGKPELDWSEEAQAALNASAPHLMAQAFDEGTYDGGWNGNPYKSEAA